MAGKRFWDDIWRNHPLDLEPHDPALVAMAAATFDECERYRSHMMAHGDILTEPMFSASGKVVGSKQVPKPAVRMLREAEKQLERWLIASASRRRLAPASSWHRWRR